jgi:hypothetical protein
MRNRGGFAGAAFTSLLFGLGWRDGKDSTTAPVVKRGIGGIAPSIEE